MSLLKDGTWKRLLLDELADGSCLEEGAILHYDVRSG